MARNVSVRELRNQTADVVEAVRAGESVTLTVSGHPVADIVPHFANRSPWVQASELRRIRVEAASDAGLLGDLAEVRASLIDE